MPDRGDLPESAARPTALTDVWDERDILAEAQALGHVGAWAWQITTGQVWWSDEIYRIIDAAPQSFPASYEGFIGHVHPDDRDEVQRRVEAAVAGIEPYDVRHRVLRVSGEVRHVREVASVSRYADGAPVRMLGLMQDITDEVNLRQALADSEERYRLLAENAWDVIWTMELDGSISYVSPSVERVRGITPQEAMTQSMEEIHPPESIDVVATYYRQLFQAIADGTEPPRFHGEQEYYRKDGSIMLGELDVIPQVDAQGHVVRILGVTRDISEQRRYEQELNRLAETDQLTGIWNRRQGERLFAADIAEARRYRTAMSLLMLDLDHFKGVNDRFGHQAGDEVLIELCRRITENLRASDVLVRWGGEEFVIVMRHCDLDDALARAEQLRALIAADPFPLVGTVTVSIGAAQLTPQDDLFTWLDRADHAMYDAKQAGRNAVRALG